MLLAALVWELFGLPRAQVGLCLQVRSLLLGGVQAVM